MSPPRGLCADFQLGLWILANSIVNINTAKSLQKSGKQFASRRKWFPRLGPGSCLGYTSTYTCCIYSWNSVWGINDFSRLQLKIDYLFFKDCLTTKSLTKNLICLITKLLQSKYPSNSHINILILEFVIKFWEIE